MKASRVCEGLYRVGGWLRLPPDARGFRQAVQVSARKRKLSGQWTLNLEHVNEMSREPYAVAGPFSTLRDAAASTPTFIERNGATPWEV